jgi:hypothetical protein
VVDVEVEPHVLRVERLRTVHVRDREEHQLEFEFHVVSFRSASDGWGPAVPWPGP